MRAWTVDADDIRVAEDLDEALLHRTPEIDGFLRLDHVEPGQIWATKEFRDQPACQPSLWRTSPVTGADFNARKGDEPDLWVRLYRLEV